ncbi:EspA/EspE family type VII secretion system effector [Mycobacterium sp. NPDC049093]
MSLLDTFASTWAQARQTYGHGTPQGGAQFDNSGQLRQMQDSTAAAAPDHRWQGSASEGYAKVNKDHAAVFGKLADLDTKMAAEIDRAAASVTAGRQNLDNIRSWVTAATGSLNENNATDRRLLAQIVSKGLGGITEAINQTDNEQREIAGRLAALQSEYQALTKQKFAPGAKPGDKTDETTGEKKDDAQALTEKEKASEQADLDPKLQADRDVGDALDGKHPEAAARVDEVLSSIKPGQDLTPKQDAYLTQMHDHQKGMSVKRFQEVSDMLGGHKNILADSWQLMSNEDVKFSGGTGEPPKGAASQLPDSVQEVLREADTKTLVSNNPPTYRLTNADDLQAISQIMKDGNPQFQTGTELDRQVMLAADRVMDEVASDNSIHGSTPAIQSLFEAVDDDHQIINDHLMGRNGVSADDFLKDVNAIRWDDHGKAAGHLFSWTNESHDSHVAGERALASETAQKYASYIGSHHELMGIDGKTLGQLNPELVQGYAHGLADYIPDIAGLNNAADDGYTFQNFEPDGQEPDRPVAKGIFSVLSTDPHAYKEFHGAAHANALAASYSWADDVRDNKPVYQNDARLVDAQTLKGLSAVGTQQAATALNMNAHDVWEQQKGAYEVAQKVITGGFGAIPVYGVAAGPSFDVFATVMQDSIIGTEPKFADYTIPPPSPANSATYALNALLARDVPLAYDSFSEFEPQKYFTDAEPPAAGTRAGGYADDPYQPRPGYHPQIHDLSGLKHNDVTQGQADGVLVQVLNATVPRIPGDTTDATQAMLTEYDKVTKNPTVKIAHAPEAQP